MPCSYAQVCSKVIILPCILKQEIHFLRGVRTLKIENIHDLLEYAIDFSNKEIRSFQQNKVVQDLKDGVVSSLLRSIIELSIGVKVTAENGLRAPSEINFRAFIEAYLAIKYILHDEQKSEDRAIAYKIGYHQHQIETAQEAINDAVLLDTNIANMEHAIKEHTNIMNQPAYKSVLDEFTRMTNKYAPKWYSLFGGPKSLKQLIEIFEDDKNILYKMYSALSKSAHSYIALRGLQPTVNGFVMLPVQETFDPIQNTFSLNVITSFLVSSICQFTSTIYPQYNENLRVFLQVYADYKKLDQSS